MPAATVSCPTCGSPSVQTVSVKRTTVPRELAAEYYNVTGAPSSDSVPQGVCERCGCRWVPRTGQERQLRALSGQLGAEAMRVAQAAEAAQAAAEARAGGPGQAAWRKIPMRTWIIFGIMVTMILLAIFTR